MSDLHELQARAADLERTIADTDDQHGSLLSGLESGLRELRERLFEAKAANDRLARENVELKSIVEQLLDRLETKPAESLHDKLAALDGQLFGLLELSGGQTSASANSEAETPVNGTPLAAAEANGAEDRGAGASGAGASGTEGGGAFDDIRERMRSLSDQLLAPIALSANGSAAAPTPDAAPVFSPVPAPDPTTDSTPPSNAGAPPKPPRVFEQPMKALAEKAQRVLPKAHLRFDAETGYALSILRRIKGNRQPFSIEEVRELINGKFGLTLTDRDDAQLSASLANQDGVTRGSKSSSRGAPSFRFVMG